ncbi:DUF1775 domain-containing protein [Streptomyces sp. NPDC005820]|uniref:DUF1775 domain-containing protein n=1 Tax=Streptomyces sp. NPDC005820 TaxID=3157069 RepID=UPI0033D15C05
MSIVSMFPHAPGRTVRRAGVVGVLTLTAALALAGPAFAHAEVEADTAQALAENVTLSFVSEAESAEAGFTEMRVVLPEGIAPGDVTLVDGPKGWKFKATSDGYTLGGPKLAVGTDAEYRIKVRQLPDAEEIAFKTVETYSDGEISRWIELPGGGAEPEQPAPVLKLKAAAPGATPVNPGPTTTGTATPSATGSTPAADASDDATPVADEEETKEKAGKEEKAEKEKEEGGSSAGLLVGGAVVALAVLGGGAWWLARRRSAAADA